MNVTTSDTRLAKSTDGPIDGSLAGYERRLWKVELILYLTLPLLDVGSDIDLVREARPMLRVHKPISIRNL